MSAEPEIESDYSTQGSSKETDKLVKRQNQIYVGDYRENRTCLIYQAKEHISTKFFKPISQENELRSNGGLDEKINRYSTPRNVFNKSNLTILMQENLLNMNDNTLKNSKNLMTTIKNIIPNSAKEKKYFIKDMSKSVILTQNKKKEEDPMNKSSNDYNKASSRSPNKMVKYNCYINTDTNLSSENKLEERMINTIPTSNVRSKSEDKMKNTFQKIINSKRKLIIDTESSVSSKNNSIRSKRDKRIEYEKKHKNEVPLQREKSSEKRSSSIPLIKSNPKKELSYDSLNEDRPKRSVPYESIAKKPFEVALSSNILPSSMVMNSMPSILSDFSIEKQRCFIEKKAENLQTLVEKMSAIKLKDLDVKNEKERNKKLERFQHKLAVLNEKGKLGFLDNEENKTNTITESDENKIEDIISSSPDHEKDKVIFESSKEYFKSNDADAPLKTSGNISKKNHNINTSSNIPNDKVIAQGKSVSSTTRKPKVDTFEFIKKIIPNLKGIEKDNDYKHSFSKENTKRNDLMNISESARNGPVRLSHNLISSITSEMHENDDTNYRKRLVLEQRKRRKEENIQKVRKEEEKNKKTYLNLKKLDAEIKSKSVSITKRKLVIKNTSNYVFRAQEDSSILDNEKYYHDIIDFIKDNPAEIKSHLHHNRFNSAKNAVSKIASFRDSTLTERDSKKEYSLKRKFSSNNNSVKQDKEVKLININTIHTENTIKNLEIITSPKSIEFNSMYNPLTTPEEEKIVDKDIQQPVTHYKFQKFLEEKIRNTVRSLDSNEIQSSLASPMNKDIYQPQFTGPISNSIHTQKTTNNFNNSGKFGSNVFPLIIEGNQKTLIIDEKTKINEFKKKYDHCIERFKTLTENSIVSNLSGNVSFKKNLGNNPPESSTTHNYNRPGSNRDVISDYGQPEKIAAQKIQSFIRKRQTIKNILKDHLKKPKNERYNILEDIKISEKLNNSHKSNKSQSPFRKKFNLISEEQESDSKSSQYCFENEMEYRSEEKILTSFSQNLINRSMLNQKNNIELKKPRAILQSHFSSESQLVNYHKNLYEAQLKNELSSKREDEYNISSSRQGLSISKDNKSFDDAQKNNTSREKADLSINNSSLSYKRMCYSFVKIPSNNTIILCPNSFDSPKLHRIRVLVEKQKSEVSFISNASESNKNDYSICQEDNSKQVLKRKNDEDSLESDEILWQNRKQSDRNKNTLNQSSGDENPDNKVLNYSRLSNIDYQDTSDNKLKYIIPEESNENDSQANKIFQSLDSEKKQHEVSISKDDHIEYEVINLHNSNKETFEKLLGESCPQNFIREEIIINNLNLSENDLNIKETNYNRFEKNLSNTPLKSSNEAIPDPENKELTSPNISPNYIDKSKFTDIDADKDISNIEWHLTINSDLSSRSNPSEQLNANTPNKFDSQKKNSLIVIKEEEENSKNLTFNIEALRDEQEESYKEEFIENIEESNTDIITDILNDNEILDIKIKPNDEVNNKDISTKSRNCNLSNDKNIDIISSVIVQELGDNLENNEEAIPIDFKRNDNENARKDNEPNSYKKLDAHEKEIDDNKENKRYSNDDDEKDNVKPKEVQEKEAVEKYTNCIINLTENKLNDLVENIASMIFHETIISELNHYFIPTKNSNKQNKTNVSVSINFPTEVQNSVALEYLSSSIILKTSFDEKRELNFNIYTNKIAPKLVEKIGMKVEDNFESLISNLSTAYYNKPGEIIQSIIFKDKPRLDKAYRQVKPFGSPTQLQSLLETSHIIQDFSEENNELREFGKCYLEYDNILNECVLDCAVEVLKKERLYGTQGEPLPWSSRTRTLKYKYDKTTYNSKKKLSRYIENSMLSVLNEKVGVLPENIEIDIEHLNVEREKLLLSAISKEVTSECEESWKNYEVEETQVKLELSEMVLEQLLNEVVEIMEHVHLSRKNPSLYLYKSIYACEEIPRLSFQLNTQSCDDEVNQ